MAMRRRAVPVTRPLVEARHANAQSMQPPLEQIRHISVAGERSIAWQSYPKVSAAMMVVPGGAETHCADTPSRMLAQGLWPAAMVAARGGSR